MEPKIYRDLSALEDLSDSVYTPKTHFNGFRSAADRLLLGF